MAAVVCLDGENNQLLPYRDEHVKNEFSSNSIKVCKLPASTAAVSQPLDIINLFSSGKKVESNTGNQTPTDVQMVIMDSLLDIHYRKLVTI